MNKHAPGPWIWETFDDNVTLIADEGLNPIASVPEGWCNEEQTEANARLIASAPDLYAALKALTENIGNVGAHDCPGFDCNRCQAPGVGWALAYDALTKAEGPRG